MGGELTRGYRAGNKGAPCVDLRGLTNLDLGGLGRRDLKDRCHRSGRSPQLAEPPNLPNHITPLDGVDPNRRAGYGGLADLGSSHLKRQQRRDDVSSRNKSALHTHLLQATIASGVPRAESKNSQRLTVSSWSYIGSGRPVLG